MKMTCPPEYDKMKKHIHGYVSRWQPSPPVQNTVSSKLPTAVKSPGCSTLQVKAKDDIFFHHWLKHMYTALR